MWLYFCHIRWFLYFFLTFDGTILKLRSTNIICNYTFVTFDGSFIFFLIFYGTILTLRSTKITCDCIFVTFGSSFIFFSHLMVPSSHCTVSTLHVTIFLSHSMVPLFFSHIWWYYPQIAQYQHHMWLYFCHIRWFIYFFLTFYGTILTLRSTKITCDCVFVTFGSSFIFFSHLMVLSSYCTVPISDVAVLHTSSVQVGNPCAQLFANSICSLLTASCLSFSSDPKKIQNISLFHQTFVYGWISMAIASSHQIPHHNWWCLPLWHYPRLTISLSHLGFSVFSFSQAQLWPSFCFHSHLSPLAVPLISVTSTSGCGSSSLILYFLSFFFFNFLFAF